MNLLNLSKLIANIANNTNIVNITNVVNIANSVNAPKLVNMLHYVRRSNIAKYLDKNNYIYLDMKIKNALYTSSCMQTVWEAAI